MSGGVRSKLTLQGGRTKVSADEAVEIVSGIFAKLGCSKTTAQIVATHLADTSLCGMESHGLMRTLQYAKQLQNGYMRPDAVPQIVVTERGSTEIDGAGGIGIPAMSLAYETVIGLTDHNGLGALSVIETGHTGRHGAFAEQAAEKGFLTICTGGGNRREHGMVAPYGGARGMLPTNPWTIGIPGGERGPVVMDFATGKIAGGWNYAARSAGALLPEGCVIDKDGKPTRDPEDYFNGGAILPMGGHKGYALSLMAEMIGEAMLGPSSPECNWFLLAVDTRKYRQPGALQAAAEEVLSDLRNCPPSEGFDRVEIPGEREREQRQRSNGIIAIPEQTWQQVLDLSAELKQR